MIEYGVMVNNQLIRHKQYQDGDKPIIKTDCPETEYVCNYYWEEQADTILQVWQITDILKELPAEEAGDEATEADYQNALREMGVSL